MKLLIHFTSLYGLDASSPFKEWSDVCFGDEKLQSTNHIIVSRFQNWIITWNEYLDEITDVILKIQALSSQSRSGYSSFHV
jgi:hypothetical protein